LDGIEGQECSGFKDIHRFLNHLPVPAGTETRSMPHADARDGNGGQGPPYSPVSGG
jgi:hypothetical protein